MINTIAIEDEPLALSLIKGYIEKTPFLNLIAVFENPLEVPEFVSGKNVDLIFLDIQMPDLKGTELARFLGKGPKIIFTTAYEKYALEGFKLDAVDYLLKPFSYDEFLKAAKKAQHIIDLENKKIPVLEIKNDFLFIKSDYKIRRINFDEIHYIEGLKDYVKVYLKTEKNPVLTLSSLKALESKLPESKFMRVHRSFIVNLESINTIERNRIVFGDLRIPITDQYKDKFQDFLDKNFL
jgi:two-component system, LytTR family, response regulator LytT